MSRCPLVLPDHQQLSGTSKVILVIFGINSLNHVNGCSIGTTYAVLIYV